MIEKNIVARLEFYPSNCLICPTMKKRQERKEKKGGKKEERKKGRKDMKKTKIEMERRKEK